MSSGRLIKYLIGITGMGGAWVAATQLKMMSDQTERGTIEYVVTTQNKDGEFIDNNKIYLKHVSPSGSVSPIDIVAEVKYHQFFAANFLKGKSSRQVIEIKDVNSLELSTNRLSSV